MAPGYRHKGVCRAGLLALDEDVQMNIICDAEDLSYPDLTRKEKRVRTHKPTEASEYETINNGASRSYDLQNQGFSYDIEFLSTFLDKERDHYNFPWSSGNCIGQREMRGWLSRLWVGRPEMRELIWKGACLALNAEKWLDCLVEICSFHNLPSPTDNERLPVGTGSNPVYLLADCAVKIFVEGGLESSMYSLGTELEFYNILRTSNSPLKSHIPEVLASGILYLENGTLKIVPWDGKGVPKVIKACNLIPEKCKEDGFSFGVWRKKQFECRTAGLSTNIPMNSAGCTTIWPFIITKRCKGKIFAELRDALFWEDALNLASFLGKQLHYLHLLPYPPLDMQSVSDSAQKVKFTFPNCGMGDFPGASEIPWEWEIFISTLTARKRNVKSRLKDWGDPIPKTLIKKVDEYIPDDLTKLFVTYQDEIGLNKMCKDCSWLHSDIMDDNIYMEPDRVGYCSSGDVANACLVENGSANGCSDGGNDKSWHPSYILDFSDLSIGDRIYDLIPIYLDIFRGDSSLFKHFLESYRLPLLRRKHGLIEDSEKYIRLSYHAMCFCILHEENVLGAIFSIWKELRTASSWEEVELAVWGELNNYEGGAS